MSYRNQLGVVRLLCHSRESGNPLKSIKKLVFIGLFYQIYNFVLILRLFFSDSRFRGNDIYNYAPTTKKLYLTFARSSHIIITLVIIDQLSKWWFIDNLRWKPGLMLKVTSFLNMVYT